MDKKILYLVLIMLIVVFGVGAYFFSLSSLDSNKTDLNNKTHSINNHNNSTKVNYTKNDSEDSIATNKEGKSVKIDNSPKSSTVSSKSEVIGEANSILNSNRGYYGKYAVVGDVEYLKESGLWEITFIDYRTGKRVGNTIIDDKTGKMPEAIW
jgi:hypothetical protein